MPFPMAAAPNLQPDSCSEGFHFPHILASCCLVDGSRSDRREVVPRCGFDLHFARD